MPTNGKAANVPIVGWSGIWSMNGSTANAQDAAKYNIVGGDVNAQHVAKRDMNGRAVSALTAV